MRKIINIRNVSIGASALAALGVSIVGQQSVHADVNAAPVSQGNVSQNGGVLRLMKIA